MPNMIEETPLETPLTVTYKVNYWDGLNGKVTKTCFCRLQANNYATLAMRIGATYVNIERIAR